jgi:predicted dehydrogenase
VEVQRLTPRSKIGAAVIGSGFIGTVHVEALRRIDVRVTGVLGSSPDRSAESAAALDVPRGYASLDDLLADPGVQAVHVTSRKQLHHRLVLAILAAGRQVICEKPLAMTSEESAELVAAARTSGLINAVNFNLRFYPLNKHVSELGRGSGIGAVRLVTGRYFQDWLQFDTDWNWRLEKSQGGALRAVGYIGSH